MRNPTDSRPDRDVTVVIPMKASKIELTRAMAMALGEFPPWLGTMPSAWRDPGE